MRLRASRVLLFILTGLVAALFWIIKGAGEEPLDGDVFETSPRISSRRNQRHSKRITAAVISQGEIDYSDNKLAGQNIATASGRQAPPAGDDDPPAASRWKNGNRRSRKSGAKKAAAASAGWSELPPSNSSKVILMAYPR